MTTMMPPEMPPQDPGMGAGAPMPPDPAMMPAAPPGAPAAPGMPPAPPGGGVPGGVMPNIQRGGSTEPSIPLNQEMEHNWLDAPIPGESLTKELGSSPWEKPPKFVELEDAMNFLFDKFLDKNTYMQFRVMVEAGVPLEAITKTVLFAGFGQGLWTMPMANLMAEPTMKMLAVIAVQSGISKGKLKIGMPKSIKEKKAEFDMFSLLHKKEAPPVNELARLTAEQPVDTEPKNLTGFLARQ